MKINNLFRAIVAIAMTLIGFLPSMAYDFEVDGIYYNILSESDKTVEVTYKENPNDTYTNSYHGNIDIPQIVLLNGIKYNVIEIGEEAFSYSEVEKVSIPEGVTNLSKRAFGNCVRLTEVSLPEGLVHIKSSVFTGCNNLATIKLPYGLKSLGSWAFYGCKSIVNIEIPQGLTIIDIGTFSFCDGLVDVAIPDGVTIIKEEAFRNCKNLSQIQLPESLTRIELRAFFLCEKLKIVSIYNTIPPTISSGDNVFTGTNSDRILQIPKGYISNYIDRPEWCDFQIEEINIKAREISMANSMEISIGDKTNLNVTYIPDFTTYKSLQWSSSDETIVLVDAIGQISGLNVGEAIITANTIDGSDLSVSCQISVNPILSTSISLNHSEVDIEEKSEIQLTATILPENTTNKEVAWSSSNSTIASVDDKGLVKVNTIGEAIITATTTDGTNLSATCHISVYTGVDGVNGENVIVMTIGDNILVKDAPLGSNVNVYSADGALVKSVTVTDGNVVVEVPTKGVYIIVVNGELLKLLLD